jgi:ditrans,polycis-polyprenyl diphosphate synthase
LDGRENLIKLIDVEKHMYMAVAPDPDILIRTSGEFRMSNFLLLQSAYYSLYSSSVLCSEIGFRHFLWAILNFQRNHFLFGEEKETVVNLAVGGFPTFGAIKRLYHFISLCF